MKKSRVPCAKINSQIAVWLGMATLLFGAILLPAVGLDLHFGQRVVSPEAIAFPLFLEVGSDEPVASLQADIGFTADSLEFFQAFPGEAASAAGKDLAVAVLGDSQLRIIVAGFNQTLVPGGVVAELYFVPLGNAQAGSVQIVGAVFSGPSGENLPPSVPPTEGERPPETEEGETTPPPDEPDPPAQPEGERPPPTTDPPTTDNPRGNNILGGGGFPGGFGNDSGGFSTGTNTKATNPKSTNSQRSSNNRVPSNSGSRQPGSVNWSSGQNVQTYPDPASNNPARPQVATAQPARIPLTGRIGGTQPNAPAVSSETTDVETEEGRSALSLLPPVARSKSYLNTNQDAAPSGYLQQTSNSSILPLIGAGLLLVLLGGLLAFRHHFRRILKL